MASPVNNQGPSNYSVQNTPSIGAHGGFKILSPTGAQVAKITLLALVAITSCCLA